MRAISASARCALSASMPAVCAMSAPPRADVYHTRPEVAMILIEHAVVVTMDGARRIFLDGSVLVDGERIAQVGRAADVRTAGPVTRVIDGRGRLVLPGFIDTHAHLSEHLSRGLVPDEVPVDRYVPDWYVPLYSAITPAEEAAAAQLACLEMLHTGTTTFCEAGTLFDIPTVAQAVDAIGLRAVLGRWTWDLAAGPGRLRQSTEEALRRTEEAFDDIKQCATTRIGVWPLLIGFGTCSEALIRGAHALGHDAVRLPSLAQDGGHPASAHPRRVGRARAAHQARAHGARGRRRHRPPRPPRREDRPLSLRRPQAREGPVRPRPLRGHAGGGDQRVPRRGQRERLQSLRHAPPHVPGRPRAQGRASRSRGDAARARAGDGDHPRRARPRTRGRDRLRRGGQARGPRHLRPGHAGVAPAPRSRE